MEKDIGSDNTFKDGDGATPCLDKSNKNKWWLKNEEGDLSPLKWFFIICLAGLFFAAINIILTDIAVSSWTPIKGALSSRYVVFLLILLQRALPVSAMLAIPLSLIMILISSNRWHGVATMFGAAIVFVILTFGGFFATELKIAGLKRLALESKDLINAIKTFEAENDAPPPNLEALVPKYFATVPRPNLAAHNEYKYEVLDPAWKGNRWKLSIEVEMLFNEFYYLPEQNYCDDTIYTLDQDSRFCGPRILIGDWVHSYERSLRKASGMSLGDM
ncbi:MAG: hypothetical protein ACOX2O_08885 [Bdellovibrionota bacterium]|jgi:hypothetical protein